MKELSAGQESLCYHDFDGNGDDNENDDERNT